MSRYQEERINVHSTLSRPTGTNKRDVRARLHLNRQLPQHTHTRARRVPKVHIVDLEVPLDHARVNLLPLLRLSVDLRDGVQKLDNARPRTLRARHIRNEREHMTSLDSAERRALNTLGISIH